jgi:hypothetical protein
MIMKEIIGIRVYCLNKEIVCRVKHLHIVT